jgi:hypothetical protein
MRTVAVQQLSGISESSGMADDGRRVAADLWGTSDIDPN